KTKVVGQDLWADAPVLRMNPERLKTALAEKAPACSVEVDEKALATTLKELNDALVGKWKTLDLGALNPTADSSSLASLLNWGAANLDDIARNLQILLARGRQVSAGIVEDDAQAIVTG